jgi:Tfp pilus assembly protein PilX
MKRNYLHDQRGLAMVVELLLVAVVLSFVGMAVYQSTKHSAPAAAKTDTKTADAKVGLAASAAAIGESEQASDDKVNATSDTSADQINDSDVDISNLGGSTSGESF